MPSGDASFPWDVKFTITGVTDPIGFMLTTPEGQSKQISWTDQSNPDPARLQTNEIITATDYAPNFDTPFSMRDFGGGVGQIEWDGLDETAYWWSTGVVTANAGRNYPAPPTSTLTLTSTTGAITDMCTYITSAGVRYDFLWEGVNLWRRAAADSTTVWTKVYTASVNITDFKIHAGVGVIAVPTHATSTIDFYTQSDVTAAATWTPTSQNHTPFSNAAGKPRFFESVRGTLYAFVDSNNVYFNTTSTADSWVGPIAAGAVSATINNISGPPGDGTYTFTGTKAVADFLFATKNNCIYAIDASQEVTETVWQWKDRPSQYNFKYFDATNDTFVFSAGPDVFTYDPTTGGIMDTKFGKKDGYGVKEILGIGGDSQYIYVLARVRVPILRSADSTALFLGYKRGSKWAFNVLWEDTSLSSKTYGVLKAMPSGVGTRLYWGLDSSSDTVTYLMDIPAEWDWSNSGSFASSTILYTSITKAGFPNFDKRHMYYNMNTLNLDASNTIAVAYTTDFGATYTTLGTANSGPLYEADFTNVNGKNFGLKLTFTSAGTVAPILKDFDEHQRIRFKYLPTASVSIRFGAGTVLRNGKKDNRSIWEQWNDLVTLRTSVATIAYTDFLGNSFNVSVDFLGLKPILNEAPGSFEGEALLTITRADKGA